MALRGCGYMGWLQKRWLLDDQWLVSCAGVVGMRAKVASLKGLSECLQYTPDSISIPRNRLSSYSFLRKWELRRVAGPAIGPKARTIGGTRQVTQIGVRQYDRNLAHMAE